MSRGKESSNRIELSRLVQELLNFGVSGSLWLWGVGGGWIGVGGGWEVPPTHVHMHAHARTCMRGKHDNFMQMAAPHWGNPWEFPMMSYARARVCACVHACACACVGGTPSPPPSPIHLPPHPPEGGTPKISQNSIALELIEIFQFCLKI